MFKRFLRIALTAVLLLGACDAATGITAEDAWARPAAAGGNGAVYFLLQNHSAGADELIGITSDIADAVEMHQSKMEGDVMQMQQVTSLPVKGKQSVAFAPGGLHVMLVGLKQELKPGDTFQITLQFREQDDVALSVTVQEMGNDDSMSDH